MEGKKTLVKTWKRMTKAKAMYLVLDKRRKNIGLNLNYKLFIYIFLAIVVINIISRQFSS